MSITARPTNNVEERIEDMLVAWLKEQVAVRGVTANVRRGGDTTTTRSMPAFWAEVALLEAPLTRLPQYKCVARMHAQTQADGSSGYDGDTDGTDCQKMLGVMRDALLRTQTVSDFNRLADGLIVHDDGLIETQNVDESEGSVHDLAIEVEITCYIP